MQFAKVNGFNAIPSATGGIARLACARLNELGVDPGVILSKVGLTSEAARDPVIRLEARTQIKFLELAAEKVQDEWLGFHLARSFDLREIGLVYYVMASSDQLADALRNAERYSKINNEGVRLRFRMQDGTAVIALDYVNIDRHGDMHHIEFWLVTLVRICRQLTNGRLSPSRLKTRHFRKETPAEFRAFFSADIEFGANADEIWFPQPMPCFLWWDAMNTSTNCCGVTRKRRQRASPEIASRSARRQRTFCRNCCRTAQSHGVGSRAEARDEFANFVAQACRGKVLPSRRYWTSCGPPSPSVISMMRRCLFPKSWLLGYREVSSLTHAFKRWTGTTPQWFRSGQLASA